MDFLTQLSIRYTEKAAVLDEEDPEWMEDEDDPEYKPSADDWGESRCDRTPSVIKTPTTSDQHVQFCTRE